jgi:HEAT repeat protein
MPTVLRSGPSRFYFWSHEPSEPPHVHVARADKSTKFCLQPVALVRNIGFRAHELRTIHAMVADRRQASLDTVTVLVQEKEKTPEAIREAAAIAIGYIGSDAKRAVTPLIEMLKSGDFGLVLAATESSGRIGREAKSALPLLIEQADGGQSPVA